MSIPSSRSIRPLVLVACTVLFLGLAGSLQAQSCVLTRLDSPILNAIDSSFDPLAANERWEASFAWRYGHSDRHFVGTVEQKQRQREHTEVINDVHLLDFSLRYAFNNRTSITLGIPYLMAERSGPLRNEQRELIGREVRSNTRGIGDISVVVNRLLFDPTQHSRSNFSIGLGLKFPTGANSETGTRLRFENGQPVITVETADQSVQPGDGGFGFIIQASGFQMINPSGSLAAYFTGTYIIEPEGDSGIYTFRSSPGEEVMSISDQYVARLGLQLGPESWKASASAPASRASRCTTSSAPATASGVPATSSPPSPRRTGPGVRTPSPWRSP